jgi:hypothetical protein
MPPGLVLPLQAADMHAWWMRRRYWETLSGVEPTPFPAGPGKIDFMHIDWSEEALRASRFQNMKINASVTARFTGRL